MKILKNRLCDFQLEIVLQYNHKSRENKLDRSKQNFGTLRVDARASSEIFVRLNVRILFSNFSRKFVIVHKHFPFKSVLNKINLISTPKIFLGQFAKNCGKIVNS